MPGIRRLWVPLVVVLLMGMLVGPSVVTATEPRMTVTRTITVPAAAFVPTGDDFDYSNYGHELFSNAGPGRFEAPLFFEARAVKVRRLTLYAYDNWMDGDVCVSLWRTIPTGGQETQMGDVCSTSAFLEPVRVFVEKSLDYRRITGDYGPYLFLDLPGPLSGTSGYKFYAVQVTYSYETG